MRLRLLGAVLAVGVAAGAGYLAATVPGHHPVAEEVSFDQQNLTAAAEAEPGDRVQAAIDGVRETGLYIGPELRGELTDDEVAAIERILAGSEVPIFLVWWGASYDSGYNTDYAAIDLLRVGVGEDGYYAVVSDGSPPPLLEAVGYESPYIDADGKGRPAAALTRIATELAALPARDLDDRPSSASDYWGGPGGGITAGVLFGVGGYLGLLVVVGLLGVALRSGRRESA